MKIVKLIPVAVVLLFLGIAFVPAVTAQQSPSQTKTLTIWMPGITDDNFKTQIVVSDLELKEIEDALEGFLDVVEAAMAEGSPGDETITFGEWETIKDSTINAVETVKIVVDAHGGEFPDLDVETYVESCVASFFNPISWLLGRSPIFSLGRGYVWIPFYDYETFIGWMIRPIFITHTLGFSAVVHINSIPFRIEYADRLGAYRLRTMLFGGIFINLGDVGLDRIKGPVLLIGKGVNKLGMDIP